MKKKIFLLFIAAFFGLLGNKVSAQLYDVNWENLVKTTFSSSNLQRQSGVSGAGRAVSENMLFANDPKSRIPTKNDGALIYTPSNNNQNKIIGFSVTASNQSEITNDVDYGFNFQTNGKVKAFTADTSITLNYSAGQELKIERTGDMMYFSKAGISILVIKVDPTENLVLRAELSSNGANFNNVKVTFGTKRFVIDPLTDNVQNTFKMQISGGSSPFEYYWEDGDKYRYPDVVIKELKFNDGLHQLKVRDSRGQEHQRSFLLGTDVTWTNFDNTQQNGTILSKTNTNNSWADAQSTEIIAQNDLFWIQYVADFQQVNKAFGLVLSTTTNFNQYNDLEVGFLLLKDNQIQVIYQGNVVLTTEYNNRDALLITRDALGTLKWMINGINVYQQNGSFSSSMKIGALLKETASLKGVSFYRIDTTPITATWNNELLSGTVNVKINYITSLNGPFHYYISENPIVPLHDIYELTKDSIYGGVFDSTLFYQGNPSQLVVDQANQNKFNQISLLKEHIFSGLENGTYYVSVFDKTGLLIIGQKVDVFPPLVMYNVDGVTNSLDVYTSTKANSKVDLNHFLGDEVKESKLDFQVITTNEKYDVGYANFPSTSSSILYGFSFNRLAGNQANLIVNGVVQNTIYQAKKNNILSLEKANDSLFYKLNGATLLKVSLSGDYLYKAQLLLAKPGLLYPLIQPLEVKVKVTAGKSQVQLLPVTPIMDQASCNDISHSAAFKVTFTLPGVNLNYSYTVKNIFDLTTIVASGNSTTGTIVNLANLPYGVYEVRGTSTNSPIPFTFNDLLTLGIEGNFDPVNNYSLTPNSYSLNKNTPSNTVLASALSLNTLKATETGWIDFESRIGSSNVSTNYFSFNSDYSLAIPNGTYIRIYNMASNKVYRFYENNTLVATQTFANGTRITAKIDANMIVFYADGALIGVSLTRPSGDIHAKALTVKQNDGFRDLLFSFTCKEEEDQYAVLKYELDGYYHIMKNGKIQFEYENEYQNTELKFNLYSKLNTLIRTESDFPSIPVSFGKNYVTIDVSQNQYCIGQGFFYLEVINEKKEKKYLRFHNDFSGCTVPIGDGGKYE